MRRLYLSPLLRSIRYYPAYPEHKMSESYSAQIHYDGNRMKSFRDETLDGILKQIKAAGFQVWGKHPLDYFEPDNALEKWFYDEWKKQNVEESDSE